MNSTRELLRIANEPRGRRQKLWSAAVWLAYVAVAVTAAAGWVHWWHNPGATGMEILRDFPRWWPW